MSVKERIKAAFEKDWDNAENNESYNDLDKKKRLMKFNRFFSNWAVFTVAYIMAALIILILLIGFLSSLQTSVEEMIGEAEKTSFWERLYNFRHVFFVGLIIAAVGYFRFSYLMRVSHGSINVGQKGTARWATREEIDAQYKKIPEKEEPFPGMGGIPIARDGDMLYIDDTNTNTLVIGGTRSGKDEIMGRPFVENVSRAEVKCSMVIADPKLEIAFSAIPTLKKRGYNTYVLNYIDPLFSDGYNPLDMIIEEYKEGNLDDAQDLCSSLAYYVFTPKPEERDPFWTDKARDVFTAFCYAEIEDNIKADIEENKRRKAAHEYEQNERKKEYFKELYGSRYEDYRKAVFIRKILNTEPDLTDDEIMEEFFEMCNVKGVRMTLKIEDVPALRHFEFKKSTFIPEPYYPVNHNEKKITLHSIVKLCNTLSQTSYTGEMTCLDMYFKERDENNFAHLTYGDLITAPKQTKGSVMSVFRKGVSIFLYDSIAKMTAESTFKIEELAFGEKPVAVFLAPRDYDKSKHFLSVVFINQIVFLLSKLSTAIPGGELPRRVHFWLNEFGNMPQFENMENTLTMGLGRNLVWTLLLQSYGQLEKYGEIKETIKDNCGNKVFIMASGEETVEEISKDLGSETQIVTNRTGKKLAAVKEFTEMAEEVPLMRPQQLKKLELGETIVLRTMKRTDNEGKTIKTHSIKNFGKYRMKLAHNFLTDVLPYDQLLYKSPNIERIIRENPAFENLRLRIAEGNISNTSHINIKKRSRNGKEYVDYLAFRNARFKAGNNMSIADMRRQNAVFDLMELSEEQRALYKIAGTTDDEGNVLYPEAILRNIDVERFARKLICCKDKETMMRGYMLLDILMPLGPKEKSEQELTAELAIENEIAGI